MKDHTSQEFDQALDRARSLVSVMGARVSRQLADAMRSLDTGSAALVEQILRHEAEINALERAVDELAGQIISRRQPAARDLRLLLALQTVTTDLERVGDEAKKIALWTRSLLGNGWPILARVRELRPMAAVARDMLGQAVEAIDRLDPQTAAAIVRRDLEVNQCFLGVLRQLVGIMVEDPRTISACLDILFIAKSLERIGDHAKNVAESVVYAATGEDVRHATAQEIEQVLRA